MPQNSSNASAGRPAEDYRTPDAPENSHKEYQDDHEIKNASESFGQTVKTEALGLDESAETNDRVTETLSKNKDHDGSGVATKNGTYTPASKKDIAAIRAELLKNIPSEQVMKHQVEIEIKKEIKYLRKRAMGLLGPNNMSYFEMANLVKKIRELRGILHALVKASFERLKTLWLRFVHGIM